MALGNFRQKRQRQKEIVTHMTPEERRRFQWLSGGMGGLMGIAFAGPVFFLVSSRAAGQGLLAVVSFLVLLIVLVVVSILGRRAACRFLAKTTWARHQGVQVDELF